MEYHQDVVTTVTQTIVKDETRSDIEANNNDTGLKKDEREKLHKATVKGDWSEAESILKNNKDAVREAITNDGSTILHIAVGIGHNGFVKNLISYIKDEDILEGRSSDGSTALHIAAIVGNTYAVNLLVEKNKALLEIKDHEGKEPLQKAYENMHLVTIGYLFKTSDVGGITRSLSIPLPGTNNPHPGGDIGVDLLVNAISAHEYNLASKLIEKFPRFAVKTDEVLMALAKTFPGGLDYEETLIYPSLDGIWERLCSAAQETALAFLGVLFLIPMVIINFFRVTFEDLTIVVIPPIKHIEKKKRQWEEAENVLKLVCDEIDKLEYSGTHHPYYTGPILEAASQNVEKVVDEILFRSPEAIQCTNKRGYDIIQLAVLHRSDKIYNLIYDIGERQNLYRTIVDSSKNNILHLAGKLAPSHELSRRTGAALQLQRELQWREIYSDRPIYPSLASKGKVRTEDLIRTP
ncbi:hypothetical protein L1887_38411 [Cichorium endivia]|nr:hypothetical protein L1887_38411 [Cichorium endivia]